MKVTTTHNNFAAAKIDHDLQGRFDLPLVASGLDVCRNFVTNFKGNAKYRCGLVNEIAFQDCAFIEFKFSNNQNYILVLYNTKMRFLSYDSGGTFGWVLDGGMSILEVTTPWSLAESKEIAKRRAYSQNRDVMYIVHEDYEPRKLTRLAANSFTLSTFSRKDDPFPTSWAASKNITAITNAADAQLTVAAHGYVAGDRLRVLSVAGMTEINDYTVAVVSVVDVNNFTIDLDTRDFTAYTSGGTVEKVTAGSYPQALTFNKGRLNYASTPTEFTTLWGSEGADYDIFTLPDTVDDNSAYKVTLTDINERIEWLYPGDNSLIVGAADGIVAVNGGGVNEPITAETIEASLTSAEGASYVQPFSKDGLIFYADRRRRNLYYFNYDLLTESFLAKDANIYSYDITAGKIAKPRFIRNIDNLMWSHDDNGNLLSLNFNARENIIGWHDHMTEGLIKDIAVITDNSGEPKLFALVLRDSAYYIERLADYVEFAERSDFYTGDEDIDEEAYYRYVAEQLKSCVFVDNAEIVSDLKSNLITYNSGAGTITASSGVFSSGDVGKHIVYKTATGYESGRFEITAYTSSTVVSVDVLQTPTANTYTDWYLTFDTVSGISRFNGESVAIVVDGGYLADFTISGGEVSLGTQATHAVIGYKYRGVLKSFCLGFSLGNGKNTQISQKAINQVHVRTNKSLGGKVGSSEYKLQPIHSLTPSDLNYLPPLPIDGTKKVQYTDDHQQDKYLYIVQDEPTPLNLNGIMLEAYYS